MRRAPTLSRLALLGLPCFCLPAQALDITVTKTTDSYDGSCNSDCSLREAVVLANATPGADRILLGNATFSLSLPPPGGEEGETYDEDENLNGDLDVSEALTIVGVGSTRSVIDANRVDRLFDVLPGASLRIERVGLSNGRHSKEGGAILNNGQLTLVHTRLQSNTASYGFSSGQGGGIANYGTAQVQSSQFIGNSASFGDTSNAWGGAIYNKGQLNVRDSLFSRNQAGGDDVLGSGGAVHNVGTADIARSLFVGNSSDGRGGAISNEGGGVLSLANSTVSGNRNNAYFPAGTIANGAFYPPSDGSQRMTLINVTIADNQGFGLDNHGQLAVRNSVIVGNWDDSGEIGFNCQTNGDNASFTARGLLLGTGDGNCNAEQTVPNADALTRVLYPLADNNSTLQLQTHALRRGSAAVDRAVGNCPVQDQRGMQRPRDGDGDGLAVCDLGAYERSRP